MPVEAKVVLTGAGFILLAVVMVLLLTVFNPQ